MALTFQDYTANGTQTSFPIPFDRIRDVHIKVFFGATEITTGWSIIANNVVFAVAPVAGTVVRIRRITDFTERLVDFVDGARLNEIDLDTDSKQAFYLLQESRDINDVSMVKNSLNNWDANFSKIQALASPTENNDAANKLYVDVTANNFASYGVAAPVTRWSFTGNGTAVVFPLTGAVLTNSAYYIVTLDGVVQDPVNYTVTTNTLTFSEAPPASAAIVVILMGYPKVSTENSVSTLSLQNLSVTDAKLANNLNLASKTVTLPNLSVTDGNLANTLNLSTKTVTLPSGSVTPSNCATDFFFNIAPTNTVIQSVQVRDTVRSQALATTGANLVMLIDGTIPAWTRGALGGNISITPKFATSKIRITCSVPVLHSAANSWVVVALFRATGPNAIGGGYAYPAAANAGAFVTFSCEEVAGTTSPIIYNIRYGGNTAGTTTINQHLSTANGNFLRAEEIKQ